MIIIKSITNDLRWQCQGSTIVETLNILILQHTTTESNGCNTLECVTIGLNFGLNSECFNSTPINNLSGLVSC